jgi:predicted nucleotidyltransferase component of viral defense system
LIFPLEEILTEKLCAFAGRMEPRDLLDANFLFDLGSLDYPAVGDVFTRKAAAKQI